jgi:hypothetical protein
MTIKKCFPWMLAVALIALPAVADTLTLKDGRTIKGKILGADDTKITIDAGGIKMEIPKADVDSVSMGESGAAPAGGQAAAPQTSAPAEPEPIQVPAGTPLKVKLGQSISSKGYAGQQFTGVLEVAMTVQGNVIAPGGTKVIGRLTDKKRSRAMSGKAGVAFELTTIELDGVPYPIVTETLAFETANKAGSTAKRTAKGAAIGGLIDGSDGAKTGAKVGLGASLLGGSRNRDVTIPAGTILDFRLYQPLNL